MEGNTGKVREIFKSDDVGTMPDVGAVPLSLVVISSGRK